MINSAPGSSAPLHSTVMQAMPGVPFSAAATSVVAATAAPVATPHADFWKWGLAFLLFWLIVTALHEYGGAAQDIGSGFALLVLSTVLLTKGGAAMTNAVALFSNA